MCTATLIGSKAQRTSLEDVLQIDIEPVSIEIDQLNLTGIEPVSQSASIGLTSGEKPAVEPTAKPVLRDLFPHSPKKIINQSNNQPKLRSTVVVVPTSHDPRSHDKKRRNQKSDERTSARSNCVNSESRREKLRQAVNRAKNRAAVKTKPARPINFIANPPAIAKKAISSKAKSVFSRIGAPITNQLAHYTIPKKPIANLAITKPPNTSRSVQIKPRTLHPTVVNTPPIDPSLVHLSRTQIKNRNRRLANKKLRQQHQQLTQQQQKEEHK